MRQLKIAAIASLEGAPAIEQVLACDEFNCMAVVQPRMDNVDRAAAMPVDAVVMYSPHLSTEDAAFLERLYMSRGRIAFVLVCETADMDILSRAMQIGITKVLTMDMGAEAIRKGISAEVERVQCRRENARVQQFDSRVIAIFSTKGGSGKTSVAVNLAVALAQSGKKVAIADLDLQFGDVGVFFNVPHCETISDLAGESTVNSTVLDSFLFKHSSGVRILCAPVSPELAELVKGEHIEKVVTVLRADYDFVILDLAPALDDVAITAMEQSDTVYFITNPEIPTLKNTRTCMGILKILGFEKKIRLVLNRDGDSFVSKRDVSRSLEMEPIMCIPYDMKASASAINRGIPVVLSSPRSPMSKAFTSFVKKGV